MLSAYSVKWFTVYYLCLGILGLSGGLYCLLRSGKIARDLIEKTKSDHPPVRLKIFLRYFLVFTIPTLFLSFFPFSWIELAFSLWCLFIIYLTGSLLLRWSTIHPLLVDLSPRLLKKYIRITGAIMLSLGGVIFILFFRIIQFIGN